MNHTLRPLTVAIIFIGILAGACVALVANFFSSGSTLNVLLLTLGSSLIATAFISLILDLFWSKERAKAEAEELQPIFKKFDEFTKKLNEFEGRFEAFKKVGFNQCYASRSDALKQFRAYADEVVSVERSVGQCDPKNATVNIVSSSARGLIGYLDREPDEIQTLWRNLIVEHPTSFRMLLTHPAYAHLRQPAEERASGDIELEILKSAIYLHLVAGMGLNELRFYRGSPTVFAIQVGPHILLNPYPYGKMAMETLCLEFESDEHGSYVSNFVGKHFNHTWAFIQQPSKRVDGKPLVEGVHNFDSILAAFSECTFLGNPKQLRLTEDQVQELDLFTKETVERGPSKTNAPQISFEQFVQRHGLGYSNPESGRIENADLASTPLSSSNSPDK